MDTTVANTDVHMRQTLITTTDAKLRPLLMSYAETSSSTANIDNLGYRMNTVYVDTTTGTIHVPGVVSDKIVSDDIENTSGKYYVHTGDTLILHCNSNLNCGHKKKMNSRGFPGYLLDLKKNMSEE